VKKQLRIYLKIAGSWTCPGMSFPNVMRGTAAAQALIIRRPEVEAVELRGAREVLYRTERSEWEGWL
jgi:hypothetical protein